MGINLDVMKNIYENSRSTILDNAQEYEKSVSYYKNKNDITSKNDNNVFTAMKKDDDNTGKDVLRRADNRVSSNFHQLLVDQEAGYLATTDPEIDVGDDSLNKVVKLTLGDDFSLTLNQLIVDASNAGEGWLHFWNDGNNDFKFAVVPPSEIHPIYADTLAKELVAVERTYRKLNTDTGNYDTIIEYWDDTTCTSFKKTSDSFNYYNAFDDIDVSTGNVVGNTPVFDHGCGIVPFIKFSKNIMETPELNKYKGSIDIYDKVYNGFANDLEDIQQTILILKGYGGTSLNEFIDNLKKYKAIKVKDDGNGHNGVDQLQIEIPTEARNIMLETTRDKIFMDGQGIDPNKFMDNAALSGKAIKGLYSHLELKASTTEKYFRPALAMLIRMILKVNNVSDYMTRNISQKWSRTKVENDLETAQEINYLKDNTSKRNIAKNNPLVDDVDQELEYQKDDIINSDGYGNQQNINNATNPPKKEDIDE
ncbi:phage portal protein [Apilactobacillus micheneri]|uniref:phage portal protein n=1 Tax=Apilactobacillus micheneri TaxID=1899430 RepID=UPI0011296D63|nr:phage portal protein [Apilactobacillus micheneri]TPR41263.1 phage portal protein [Apilactobacillus micheneri]